MEDTFYIGGYFYDIREVHQLLAAEGRKRGRGVFVFDFTLSDLDSKPYFGGIGFRTLNVFTQNGHLTGRSEATTPCPHFCTPASIEQSNIIMDSLEQYDTAEAYAVMFRKFEKLVGGGIILFNDDEKLEATIDDLADYFKQHKKL